jgi:ferredoxin
MRDRGLCKQCETLSSDCFDMIDDGIDFHLAR